MKTSGVYFSVLVVISNAQDQEDTSPMLRGKGRGGGRGGGGGGGGGRGQGHGGRGGGKNIIEKEVFSLMNGNCYWGDYNSKPLLERIEEECNSNSYTCDTDNPSCNASWHNMVDGELMVEGCPVEGLDDDEMEAFKTKLQEKKEMWVGMSKEERKELREEKKAINASNVAAVLSLGCGCCDGNEGESESESETALAALVRGREGAVAKALGFRKPKGEGGGLFGQLGSGLASGGGGGLLGQLENGGGSGILSQLGNGDGDGLLSQIGSGEGAGLLGQLGSGGYMEKMLAKKCPGFQADYGCDTEEPDCTIFDTMTMKRDRQGGPIRDYMLRCGCCERDV
mmetsp:Transcript_27168/g.56564  ORF Transcript_27168/g.56564 Transcript_27168/m.56564 type:complete len:339 (-) Transcript_27168:216-1232(-)